MPRRVSGSGRIQRRLVILVKVPAAGRVKTRLARGAGVTRATAFYRSTCAAVIGRLVAPGRWQTLIAVAPDTGVASRAFPFHLARLAQGGGDIGARMQRALAIAGPGPVIVIGSDIPAVRPAHIAHAFRRLGDHDAVFGPAEDGGFWLVGLRRVPRLLTPFRNVRWSAPETLADTLANLAGRRVALVQELNDVDELPDLVGAAGWSGRRVLPSGT